MIIIYLRVCIVMNNLLNTRKFSFKRRIKNLSEIIEGCEVASVCYTIANLKSSDPLERYYFLNQNLFRFLPTFFWATFLSGFHLQSTLIEPSISHNGVRYVFKGRIQAWFPWAEISTNYAKAKYLSLLFLPLLSFFFFSF